MKHIEKGKYNNLYGNWKIGKGTTIGSFCDINGIIGEGCKIQSYVFIPLGVEIGNNCFIGPGVIFTNNKKPDLSNKDWKPEKTIIEDGAVIGASCTILPGITIGEGAFVGAGSLVTKDIPVNEKWRGSPAMKYE